MLSNRHLGKPDMKPKAPQPGDPKQLMVSNVAVTGGEVLVAKMDWDQVEDQKKVHNSLALLRHLFPNKNLAIVSRDNFQYGRPTVFFGLPDIVRAFKGRQIDEFRWTPVSYKA